MEFRRRIKHYCDHCLRTCWFVWLDEEEKYICARDTKKPADGCGRRLTRAEAERNEHG